MSSSPSTLFKPVPLRALYRDRLALWATLWLGSMALSQALRLVLYFSFHEGPFSLGALLYTLVVGPFYDAPIKWLFLMPFALWLALGFGRTWRFRPMRATLLTVLFALAAFHTVIEYYFFDEFEARFNHIALDYVRHPSEVIGNIWESYNVPLVLALSLAAGLGLAWPGLRRLKAARFERIPWRARGRAVGVVLLSTLAVAAMLRLLPDLDDPNNRVTGEIAANGLASLVRAFRTAKLDYRQYYASLPDAEAAERAARVLKSGIAPAAPTDAVAQPWDVVVIFEESLGSEFIGALGNESRRTSPGFDRWALQGLFLTGLVSTGNRTVRGLEGTLCSLVPLPGDAVLKRNDAIGLATLAEVFRRRSYKTAFVYGGWGTFDSMKPFMPNNGFEEFIERSSMPNDAFATIWGVADEYMFDTLLARQRKARANGERLFVSALTVSNHKPYEVPERGTAWPASKKNRESAVAYSDWALARYLDMSQQEGLLDHTLVLVLGDHGARVYGREMIPAQSYRIPALFVVPGETWDGKRIDRLSSQIDLAPTLLSLVGVHDETPFLGEDLTRLPADGGRAFLQHNRNVGMLTDNTLVVLGLKKRIEFYTRPDRHSDLFTAVEPAEITPAMHELAKDAMAVYQTTYDALENKRYHLPQSPGSRAPR
ncbi:MAG: sulfatase-like hydrolase/transferase [Acidobacteriota bacterium]